MSDTPYDALAMLDCMSRDDPEYEKMISAFVTLAHARGWPAHEIQAHMPAGYEYEALPEDASCCTH